MTEAFVVYTDNSESKDAGRSLGYQIMEGMDGSPDVVILFAGPHYDHEVLLSAFKQVCSTKYLLGSSSAGEFTSQKHGENTASALALRSADMHFAVGVGRDISKRNGQVAEDLLSSFQGLRANGYPYHSALVLADALAGHMDDLIEQLTTRTAGSYQFFGGGAGDNAQFRKTPVFYGTEVVSDAVVALEILSKKPLGIGLSHGWQPNTDTMLVTEAKDLCVLRINDKPAIEVFQKYAEDTGQYMDADNPIPFFLHNLIGIDLGIGYKLRVPLAFNPDGSVVCAAEVPQGSAISLMRATTQSASDAAAFATRTAMQKLYGSKPAAAIFFDCVATRLRMGKQFGVELETLQQTLGSTCYAGCNTHGQIARVDGQFSGFHNCTAVVCVIPE